MVSDSKSKSAGELKMSDEVREISRELAMAKVMMPLADKESQQILAQSGMMQMMLENRSQPCSEYPKHHRGQHHDVTGFFQRTRKAQR